jgi:Rrp15p
MAASRKRARAEASTSSGGAGGFGAALSKVLSRELHASEAAGPVLAKRRTAAAKLAAAEREQTIALRKKAAEKKAAAAARNVLPSAATADAEKELRRVATKGVVALFNAITRHKREVEAVVEEPIKRRDKVANLRKAQASFLDLIKLGSGEEGGKAAGSTWLADGFVEKASTHKGHRNLALKEKRHDESAAAQLLDDAEF